MAMWIVHRLSVKFRTMLRRSRAPGGHRPVVAFAVVEMMIDVAVKMVWSVEPGSGPNEHAARKPLRPVVAIWSAVVRWDLVVPVRTNRWFPNADRNLRGRVTARSHKKAGCNNQKTKMSQFAHNFPPTLGLAP